MVIRLILFSFFISIINLLIAVTIPIDIPVSDTEKIVSPYREELDEMKNKGLNEEENKRYLELIEKNNLFLINDMEQLSKSITAKDISDAWEKKFILLSPIHILIWGIASYFLLRRKVNYFYLFLSSPLAFTIIGVMPLSGFMIITVSVMAVWFWSILQRVPSGADSIKK